MFCMPPATMRSAVPDRIACAPKEIACWLDPHWRSTVTPGTSSGYPAASHAGAAMLPACPPMRVDATDDDVVDRRRVDVHALEQTAPCVRAQVDGMHAGQRAVPLADGVRTASMMYASGIIDLLSLNALSAVMPPRTMERYWRPTCSAVSGPPG